MYTLLIFIAILALLVLSHEFGHFFAARKNGIKVEEFGFGFPPRIFGLKISDTVYSLNLIPLGGFVKIKGEDGSGADEADSFASKKIWQKAVVLAAGVAMNVVLAAVLLSAGYMIGLPQMVADLPDSKNIQERRLEIAQVLPDKPAAAAGILPGDVVVGLDGLDYPRLKKMQQYVDAHKNEILNLVVERDGQIIKADIQPIVYADTGKGGLGVAIVEIGIVKYPWYLAIYYGTRETGVYLKEIVVAFGYFFQSLFSGADVSSDMAGPVGIAVLTGRAARLGLAYLIQFTAILSLNLALINILPIPALDGGRLLFLLIAKLRRRSVNKNLEQWFHTVGFALLMLLVIFITVQDVQNFRGAISAFFKRLF